MIVEHSTKQIIGRSQSVHVTCKMEVDVLHRYHLCIAATCCSTLYSKYWPKGRFSQGDDCFFADFRHGLSKTCCCSGFAFPCWGWIDCCHQDQFAIFLILQAIIQRIVQFCLISSIRLQLLFANTKRSGDLCDGSHLCLLGNLDIRQHSHSPFQNGAVSLPANRAPNHRIIKIIPQEGKVEKG